LGPSIAADLVDALFGQCRYWVGHKGEEIYRGNCLVEIQRPPVIGIGIGPVRDAVPIGFIDKRIEA